jgi:hypothetical protein
MVAAWYVLGQEKEKVLEAKIKVHGQGLAGRRHWEQGDMECSVMVQEQEGKSETHV